MTTCRGFREEGVGGRIRPYLENKAERQSNWNWASGERNKAGIKKNFKGQQQATIWSMAPQKEELQSEASLVAQRLKLLPGMQETRVQSLSREDPLEKEMATHSSTLAWRIPWREEPGRLPSTGSQRIRHDWAISSVLPKKKSYRVPSTI